MDETCTRRRDFLKAGAAIAAGELIDVRVALAQAGS
jgi:hypothetical protein